MRTLRAALGRLLRSLGGRLLTVGLLGSGDGGLERLGALGKGSLNSLVPGRGFTGNSAGHCYYFVYRFLLNKIIKVH
jgi:hypothetical protein